jgi:spore maturation protein CgeB
MTVNQMVTNTRSLDIVILGLAITSSWGNGHATTYRSLAKGLHRLGHHVTFLERDQPWYAQNRDAPALPYCETHLYTSVEELRARFGARVRSADAVIVGSYVQDGVLVCDWALETAKGVRAFYDIDTPVTLTCLRTDTCEYLRSHQIAEFDLMLSFTGGPTLRRLESAHGARSALPLYCSVDVDAYRRVTVERDIDLGYMGTYSADRQPGLEALLNEPARQLPERNFMVVGAQYPRDLQWPSNVRRMDHLPPKQHPHFYSRQRCTLNLTRADMRAAGHSPSVRLFEAAACGTPVISDAWPGLEEVFRPNDEILIAHSASDVVRYLREMDDAQLQRISRAARERVLAAHSSERRAAELVAYIEEVQHRAARVQIPEARARVAQTGTVG